MANGSSDLLLDFAPFNVLLGLEFSPAYPYCANFVWFGFHLGFFASGANGNTLTGNAASKFNRMDTYVWQRLHGFMVKRKGRHLHAGEADGWTRPFFHQLGLHRLRGTIQYPGVSRMPRSETSSVSRVREIRTHGLKGGSTPHRVTHGVT